MKKITSDKIMSLIKLNLNFATLKKFFSKNKDKELYLLFAVFFFVTTFSLSLVSVGMEAVSEKPIFGKETIDFDLPQIPVLGSVTYPIVSATAALAVDLDSQVSLYEKDPDEELLPASTTKIMTAITALNYYSPDDIITINETTSGQKIGLMNGEKYKAIDLIKATLVYSANDAAVNLASNYPGGGSEFVKRMNDKAREMSLTNTNFENVVGFDGKRHYSTARDLVRVSEIAMRDPEFSSIVNTKTISITELDSGRTISVRSTNDLLGRVDGVMGIKTGWTENARENLVTYVERGGKRVIIAVLGSSDRFGETEELIDWIFGNYSWKNVSEFY